MNVVYNVCSVITLPVEMALRPRYGSRYFPPIIVLFSAIMMVLLPFFSEMADGFARMIPFVRFRGPEGLFDIGTLSRLYFFGAFIHNLRIWRRMLHMELEINSFYEGPPLPFFRILPGKFWIVRIVYEPLFVYGFAEVLANFFILQSSAEHYLIVAALMLAMKQYVAWYRQWEFLRGIIDIGNAGPIIARFIQNQATDDDLETIHVASVPKDMPDEVRRSLASHIARVFTPKP